MNISVNEHYEKLIKQMIESGEFTSDSEVVQAALELLEKQQQKLEALRRDMKEGFASGPGKPIDENTVNDIIARGQERLAQRQNAD